jgi:hypothetical protein
MKSRAASNDRLCSQCGPIVSVMSQAENHETPTIAEIAAAAMRSA